MLGLALFEIRHGRRNQRSERAAPRLLARRKRYFVIEACDFGAHLSKQLVQPRGFVRPQIVLHALEQPRPAVEPLGHLLATPFDAAQQRGNHPPVILAELEFFLRRSHRHHFTTSTLHGASFVRFWEVPPQMRPKTLEWPMKPTTSKS